MKRHDLRAEFHDIFRGYPIDQHAIDFARTHRARGFRTPDELQNAGHPGSGLFGEVRRQQLPIAAEVGFHGASDEVLFQFWQFGVTE